MKKALVFLMCIVLTVCTVFTVSATNAPTAAVSASASKVTIGDYFTVSVSVDSCADVVALGLEIECPEEICFTEGEWNTAAFSAGNNIVTTQLGNFNYVDGRGVITFEVKDADSNVLEGAGVTLAGKLAELKFVADGLVDAAKISVKVVPVGTDNNNIEIPAASTEVSVAAFVPDEGWNKIGDIWYYYENGEMVRNDWRKDSIGWCYLSETGAMVTNNFVKDSVGSAYITPDGYFYETENGWKYVEEIWYYVENGYAVMGDWRKDSIGWCYLGEDGAMLTNVWLKDSIGWCYLDESGYWDGIYFEKNPTHKNGWIQEGGIWYYYEENVKVTNNWRKDSTGWCFLDEDGKWVLDAFVKDSVGWAYITKDGYFYYDTNGWIKYYEDWYFLEGGYAVTNQWREDSIGWCYLSETGAMVTNNFVKDSVGYAYITEDGYFYYTETGWKLVDDVWYYVENGYMVELGTYVAFGDSITFGAEYTNNYKQMENPYPKLVGETLNFDSVNNQGVSGAFFCENTLGYRCMTNTILNFTGDADVISVMLGVNDWSRGMQLGTPTDKTKTTIYGCLNLIAEYLTTNYSDSFVFFMTPYKALEKWNVVNHDMYELSDVADAVKEIAAKYDIPVLDMYNLGNYEVEMNNSGNDGCHPSQEFMIKYAAPQVAEFIRQNYNK